MEKTHVFLNLQIAEPRPSVFNSGSGWRLEDVLSNEFAAQAAPSPGPLRTAELLRPILRDGACPLREYGWSLLTLAFHENQSNLCFFY